MFKLPVSEEKIEAPFYQRSNTQLLHVPTQLWVYRVHHACMYRYQNLLANLIITTYWLYNNKINVDEIE